MGVVAIDAANKEFFTDLYLQYYHLMKKIAFGICREYSVVDDLVNEAFINIFNKTAVIKPLKNYQRTIKELLILYQQLKMFRLISN
ncbi:DNA-directed RNA polymerase specialized sigma24 family protein [Fontibacillus solani]|uniref:DNA-directed RNA polymerase specialized sigma24 family protein n=1 Tax=Fontibacillus solani TaxID=1572857 RepID=A0A7W3SQ99_9BACL|nr:DNA-directed RNA polymerase specialized sigma24 family protein [Fontibacillus solani]